MTGGLPGIISTHRVTGQLQGEGGSRLVGPARTTEGPQRSEDHSEAWPAEREAFLPAEHGLCKMNV